ncbi:MAG TPA: DUF3857 domain-containing protein, partial [Verrucomicrobiae bacterium]
KESIDDSQMAENIYDPNIRVLRVNIPQLEIGDLVHTVARQTVERSIMPDEYDEENIFEGDNYIHHVAYEVHAPLNLPLQRIALRAEIPGTVASTIHTNANAIVYHWEVNNVPQMFDEPSMPPYDMVLQRLFVSTVPDWQTISKWYWNLSLPHLEKFTPEMQQTNANLIANQPTDLDKVKAIFYYVSKNIRYMGLTPEKDRPGFEPHDVSLTFDKKYGVCRDKAGLLVEMLRMAGFNAYPVLINVGARRDKEVPEPDFNHAIVCVELKKGEYTLMDPTDENTRDLLPSYDCNRSYLVCRPEGETLLVSPVPPPEKHMLIVKTTGTLSTAGRLQATSELSFEGVNDDAYRNLFSHLKPDDERRFFEQRLKEVMPGARVESLKITPQNVLDVSVPLHAELKFSATGLTASGDDKSVVSLPWITRDLGVASRILLDSIGLATRKYPLQTEVTCGVQEEVSLKLGNGFAAPISIPAFASVDDDCVDYQEHAAYQNGSLDCTREFKLKTVEFSPAEYLKLKQVLKDMAYDGRKNLILALKPHAVTTAAAAKNRPGQSLVESDAEILTSHKTLKVTDPHTAVYTVAYSKRILNYGGKIREADIKIDYNPACEEARIIHAVVISKTGARHEISPGEINVMDQGWNPSAKRYTGGKVLVADLPGVEIGSTIEVEFQITMKDLPFLAGFEPFQFPDALDKKSFELIARTNVIVSEMTTGGLKKRDEIANGLQTIQWQSKKVKALPAETQVPPAWNYEPGVDYFVGNPADYWKALNDAMLAHSQKSTQAAAMARQLTSAAKTKLDAIKAIRDFIAVSIREAGPSFTDVPLSELSDADTTLADGYGHAADRAILFYAMLTAAGFQPEFVLASGLPPIAGITNVTQSFPLPDNFTAPLVKITVDGEPFYLNDTDQYSQLGTTPYDDKLGMLLSGQKLETIHAAKNCQDKTDTDYAVSLTDDGRAQIKISRHYYGGTYNSLNRYFSELPPEERKHYFQELVSGVGQGAQPVGDLTTKFDTYPGLEQFTVTMDRYAVVDGKFLYFALPFTPSLFSAGADQRSLPFYISQGNEQIIHTEIEMPPGFHQTGIVPQAKNLVAPGGSHALVTSDTADGKYEMEYQMETVPAIVSPKDYPAMLNLQTILDEKPSTVFLLERE